MLSLQSRFSIIEIFTLFIIVIALYYRPSSKKISSMKSAGESFIYAYLTYAALPVLILCVLGHQISFFS